MLHVLRLAFLSLGSAECTHAVTTAQEEGWRDLTAASAWRAYQTNEFPSSWQIANGILSKKGDAADIITRDKFENFELTFDWKLSAGGNSGVFYRGTEEYSNIYWSAPEYQLLDDAGHPDGKSRLTSAAALYALYPTPAGIVKPANEWNSARIVARGAHVEHWLNGQKVVEFEQGSPDWDSRVAASKFKVWPNFGKHFDGYIGIQGDHPGTLEVRNIRIRRLK
jgi:hypothetical protein